MSARFPKVHERRHDVLAVPPLVDVDEGRIDNRMAAALDVCERRVDDVASTVTPVIAAVTPAVTVTDLDEI